MFDPNDIDPVKIKAAFKKLGISATTLKKVATELEKIPELKNDTLFSTYAMRVKNRELLNQKLKMAFSNFEQEFLLHRYKEQKIPAGIIRNMQQVFEMPIANKMILKNKHGGKCVRTVAFSISENK